MKYFEHQNLLTPGASFNPNGDRILTHSHYDGNFYLWDIKSGDLLNTFSYAPRIEATAENQNQWSFNAAIASFTPDGNKIIIAAPNLTVQLWDADSGRLIQRNSISEVVQEFQIPLFSEDGRRLMIPLQGGKCYTGFLPSDYSSLPDFVNSRPITEGYAFLANSGEIKPTHLPQRGITSAVKRHNKDEIIIGSDEGAVKSFSTKTGEIISDAKTAKAGAIIAISQSLNGAKIATLSSLGSINIWETDNLTKPIKQLYDLKIEKNTPQEIHFGPKGNHLWLHNSKETKVWNIVIYNSKANPNSPVVELSTDNQLVAISGNRNLKIFTTGSNDEISSYSVNLNSRATAV